MAPVAKTKDLFLWFMSIIYLFAFSSLYVQIPGKFLCVFRSTANVFVFCQLTYLLFDSFILEDKQFCAPSDPSRI